MISWFMVFTFFLSLVSTQNQYQQCIHMKGDVEKNNLEPVFGETGKYEEENTIGGIHGSVSFLINDDSEILVFLGNAKNGESNMLWKFSIEKKEWMFLKGSKTFFSDGSNPEFDEINSYSMTNQIDAREFAGGWIDKENQIITIFGGHKAVFDTGGTYPNDIWRYSIDKNMYSLAFENVLNESFTKIGEFADDNVPLGRINAAYVNINDDFGILFAGYRDFFTSTEEDDAFLDDHWIYSSILNQWKCMKIRNETQIPIYGKTNIYDHNNTIGAKLGVGATKINNEEILLFGGFGMYQSENEEVSKKWLNIVHKYNISSNQFKYISGNKNLYAIHGRNYTNNNQPGGRCRMSIWKINNNEIMLFGGFGNGIEYATHSEGYLNDLWKYDFSTKNQWKFEGKEDTMYLNRFATNEFIGGVYDYVGHFSSKHNSLFLCLGKGNTMFEFGNVNVCWKIYFGNMCFSIEDTNPLVCSSNGVCLGNNQCQCNENFYGEDCSISNCYGIIANSSEVCSENGICINQKCACFDSSAYTNPDCSLNEALQSFMNNLWIYITLPTIFILIFLFFVFIITILGITILKLRKTTKKFDGIEDIDLILQEAKLEQSNTNPKIKINKALFEINYSDIQILSILGEGGSGTVVYYGKWKGNFCAFKAFKGIDSTEFYEEFEKEVKIYSSINHPSILQFYGASINLPKIGILLEFAKNGDIPTFLGKFQYNKKRKYFITEKLRILYEIISGMKYLHSKKILHRDLKPENVLIDEIEHAKIMDFGLSKLRSPNEEKTMTKRIGTSYYMAPEVFNGKKYDEKCDVYSWAILAYVVITENFFPYGTEISEHLVLKKISKNPNFRPKISKNDFVGCEFLEGIIKRNWNSDPTIRDSFDEISEFFQDKIQKYFSKMKELENKRVGKKELLKMIEKQRNW